MRAYGERASSTGRVLRDMTSRGQCLTCCVLSRLADSTVNLRFLGGIAIGSSDDDRWYQD
jgi:hypothetical protein